MWINKSRFLTRFIASNHKDIIKLLKCMSVRNGSFFYVKREVASLFCWKKKLTTNSNFIYLQTYQIYAQTFVFELSAFVQSMTASSLIIEYNTLPQCKVI